MSNLRLRSFTVPKGSNFVCVPQDGSGPLIVPEGAQVAILVGDTWDEVAREMLTRCFKPEPSE